MEKILQKKIIELNKLKGLLGLRTENDKNQIVDNIKYVIEDITLLLSDFGYIRQEINIKEYTLDELSKYDGQNGTSALVAIFGTIYDVSDSEKWKVGMHFGVKAGGDLSEYFKSCHKGNSDVLKNLRIVGVLVQ